MWGALILLIVLLPVLALTGLLALAAFSVLYVNGVAPDRFESADARRRVGPRLPETRIGGPSLLAAFLVLLYLPLGLFELGWVRVDAIPASPERLLAHVAGLLAAVLFLFGWDKARGGSGMLPWGGGKLSRPVFALGALLPLLVVVAVWNSTLVTSVLGNNMPTELVHGLSELEGASFWGSIALAVLVGPALEELLFRGAVFGAAGRMAQAAGRTPGLLAVFFPALAFTVLHPPAVWLPLFVLGLALGCVRLHGHGVRDCILLHMAYNGLVLFLVYPVS